MADIETIAPTIIDGYVMPVTTCDAVAHAFPSLETAKPGDLIGISYELARVSELTIPIGAFFLQAGDDLETWTDYSLQALDSDVVQKQATRDQLQCYATLRELDFPALAHYDDGWMHASFDGIPCRALSIVSGAEIVTESLGEAYYDEIDDIARRCRLYWRMPGSAHGQLASFASRRAVFALFTELSQLSSWDEADVRYDPAPV